VRSTPVGSPMRLPPRSCRIGGFQSMRIAGSRRLGERARHVETGDAGKEVDRIGERRRRARLPQGRGDEGSEGHVRKAVAAGHGCRARCLRAHWGRARREAHRGRALWGMSASGSWLGERGVNRARNKTSSPPPDQPQAQHSGPNIQGPTFRAQHSGPNIQGSTPRVNTQGQHSGSTLRVNLRPTQ